MSTPKPTKVERKAATKELLLADHRYLTEAFLKNEQIGETRVNWFIGIVTGSVGGLIALVTKGELSPLLLRLIVLGGLFSLLSFGLVTLFRIITRNINTDGYKEDLDKLRQLYSDHFDSDNVLTKYHPFGPPPKPKKRKPRTNLTANPEPQPRAEKKAGGISAFFRRLNSLPGYDQKVPGGNVQAETSNTQPETDGDVTDPPQQQRIQRRFGGLAHTVAVINSLLAGALAAAIVHIEYGMRDNLDMRLRIGIATAAALVIMVASFVKQHDLVSKHEGDAREKLRDGRATHAGGVVVNKKEGVVKYLIVRPQDGKNEWVLPKGHIQPRETHAEAALREVCEEAGAIARIIQFLDSVEYEDKQNQKWVKAKFYLMEMISETDREEEREQDWLPYQSALEALTHPEAKYLLALAEQVR